MKRTGRGLTRTTTAKSIAARARIRMAKTTMAKKTGAKSKAAARTKPRAKATAIGKKAAPKAAPKKSAAKSAPKKIAAPKSAATKSAPERIAATKSASQKMAPKSAVAIPAPPKIAAAKSTAPKKAPPEQASVEKTPPASEMPTPRPSRPASEGAATAPPRPAGDLAAAALPGPGAGDRAPEFKLTTGGGQEVALSEFAGKSNVVLYFYPKDMTPGCTAEACAFRDAYLRIRSLGAEILGVSMDDERSHKTFAEKYSLPFPLLADTGGAASKAYGVYKEKSLYGRTFWGIERSTFLIGKDGRVRKAWRKVKVDGHDQEVLEALGGLS